MAPKDLAIIDTKCSLNDRIVEAFTHAGLEAEVLSEERQHVRDHTLALAAGTTAVCIFVNKKFWPEQIETLKKNGTKLILCCSAGYDNVPLDKCRANGIRVARVPSYSPSSIAEYAVSSALSLAKNMQKSFLQTRQGDFTIGGLQCLLLEDKTAGILGTGLIGKKTATKLASLVKEVVCFDAYPDEEWIKTIPNARYVGQGEVFALANIISIHVPLLPATKHLVNKESLAQCQKDVIIINTSRGEVVNTADLVEALKGGKVFGAALDVFEGEKAFIYKDMTEAKFTDFPLLNELASMDNVILSSHVAFYTDEATKQIADATLANFKRFTGHADMDESFFVA